MGLIFLDTSGLYAAADPKEPHHGHARDILATPRRLLTHNYVLAEFIALAHARRFSLHKAIAFLHGLASNSLIRVAWVNKPLHKAAMSLLEQRLDKAYSLCDAVSFVLMKKHRSLEALTTDRHFEQEGFLRLLTD